MQIVKGDEIVITSVPIFRSLAHSLTTETVQILLHFQGEHLINMTHVFVDRAYRGMFHMCLETTVVADTKCSFLRFVADYWSKSHI